MRDRQEVPEEGPPCAVTASSSGMYPLLLQDLPQPRQHGLPPADQTRVKPESTCLLLWPETSLRQSSNVTRARVGGGPGQASGDWGDSSTGEEALMSAMQHPRGERPSRGSGAGQSGQRSGGGSTQAHCKNKPSAGCRRRRPRLGIFWRESPLGHCHHPRLPARSGASETSPPQEWAAGAWNLLLPVLGRGSGGASG